MEATLRRRAGNKIRVSGTDQVIHFTPMAVDEIVEAMEWHELIQFRRLRNAMALDGIQDISIEGQSVYFLAATVLNEVVQSDPKSSFLIMHDQTRFAPVIEAMKALSKSSENFPTEHECYGVPKNCMPLLEAYHGSCDLLPSAHYIGKVAPILQAREHVVNGTTNTTFH